MAGRRESVRDTVERSIGEAKGEKPKHPRIGLARIPEGVQFRCGDCEYFGKDVPEGQCGNRDPELHGKEVDAELECCDLYDHEGMERLID